MGLLVCWGTVIRDGEWPSVHLRILQLLPGNNDTRTPHTNHFLSPFLASKVRLLPYSELKRSVCVRLEVYGCAANGACTSIPHTHMRIRCTDMARVAYRAPAGEHIHDHTYTDWPGDTHTGLLLDGVTGSATDEHAWLGWSRHS
jgi:discoidin domain receptor family protein 2